MSRTLVVATGNAGKAREIGTLLAGLGLTLRPLSDFSATAPEEDGVTYLENALIKARAACRASGLSALAEDSGLEVDALAGAPGLHSARYAGPGARDADNLACLLEALREVPAQRRTARFRCAAVFLRSAEDPWPLLGFGTWEGMVAAAPVGEAGFGYDPVFLPAGDARSAAQLAPEEKLAASHRGQALRALAAQLHAAFQAPSSSLSSLLPR